ncbi:MAG: 50S ribosomal protein L25/general stress protein Ctc [Alphaproteobacteria bacterium]|nr:50S ribosomal protein L25/general stress protein Ctc [Alphaproteobacteria bacterium]
MTDLATIPAKKRPGKGTGDARAVRRTGDIPGVLYGAGIEPRAITITVRDIAKHYESGRFTSTLFELNLDGEKMRVIPREVQVDPVSERPIHADFQRLVAGARIRLFIPVHFNNHGDSPGLKRGGVLNIVRHEIEFFCPSERIPQYIEADLKGMDIGDSLHISHIKVPEGLVPVIRNRDFTVATVAAPSALTEVETKPAAAAEGEAAAGAAPVAGAAPAAGVAPAAGGKAAAPAAGGKAAAAPAAGAKAAPKAPAAKK